MNLLKFRLLVLYFATASLCVEQVQIDFDKERVLGPLKIDIDKSLGKATQIDGNKPSIFYSSYLEFPEPHFVEALHDDQLLAMCQNAWLEYQAVWKQDEDAFKKAGISPPSVVSVLAAGKHVVFASSQSGISSFILNAAKSPAKAMLQECWAQFPTEYSGAPDVDPDAELPTNVPSEARKGHHQFEYRCGEIMAAHIWFRLNPLATSLDQMGGRIAAFQGFVNQKKPKLKYVPPCADSAEEELKKGMWGCARFVDKAGLKVIKFQTPREYDVAWTNWIKDGNLVVKSLPLCAAQ